jgi:hypothetical protein
VLGGGARGAAAVTALRAAVCSILQFLKIETATRNQTAAPKQATEKSPDISKLTTEQKREPEDDKHDWINFSEKMYWAGKLNCLGFLIYIFFSDYLILNKLTYF